LRIAIHWYVIESSRLTVYRGVPIPGSNETTGSFQFRKD